ncbi:YitT family protein [Flavobacterium sp.]|uniref:YitT family protein n=1 Tax=Flavobacterium sp. TaxID=239 RepID=UPI0037506835
MNSFWKQVIIQTTLKNKGEKTIDNKNYSNFVLAKGYREFLINIKRLLKDLILITIGIFSASFGFKVFLLTNHFIDGGATGISLLISALTEIPLYILIICVNIPFILLAYNILGKPFAVKTTIAITTLELNKLNTEIEKIEPTAFVVMNSVKDTKGGIIKKRPLEH